MKDEKGYILVLGLLFLIILTLLATATMNAVIFATKIVGNRRQMAQAFYNAESGWNVVLAKLTSDEITDTASEDANWGSTVSNGEYSARVTHMLNSRKVVTKYGNPVYIVTGVGNKGESRQLVQVQIVKRPSYKPVAALYSKGGIVVRGSSSIVSGKDICGSSDIPGIISRSDILINGDPIVDGVPAMIPNSTEDVNLLDLIGYLKYIANASYTYDSDVELANQDWGSVSGEPPTPDADPKIVYFDMGGSKKIKLNSSRGTGILLVNGSLDLSGGFAWYGLIIVTGDLKYSGGGEKSISGSVFAGNSTSMDVNVGGNGVIKYCSKINDFLNIPKYRVVAWRQIYGEMRP